MSEPENFEDDLFDDLFVFLPTFAVAMLPETLNRIN